MILVGSGKIRWILRYTNDTGKCWEGTMADRVVLVSYFLCLVLQSSQFSHEAEPGGLRLNQASRAPFVLWENVLFVSAVMLSHHSGLPCWAITDLMASVLHHALFLQHS